jgi:hypothetical protein
MAIAEGQKREAAASRLTMLHLEHQQRVVHTLAHRHAGEVGGATPHDAAACFGAAGDCRFTG